MEQGLVLLLLFIFTSSSLTLRRYGMPSLANFLMSNVDRKINCIVCSSNIKKDYISNLMKKCLPIKNANSVISIVQSSQLSSLSHKNYEASLYVWCSDDMLSKEDEKLRQQCTFSLCLLPPTTDESSQARNTKLLKMWVDRLLGLSPRPPVSLEAGRWSHFLCLTYPDLLPHQNTLPLLLEGVDAVELRVDLLADKSVCNVHKQLSMLRAACSLPTIFTVRTRSQLGTYEDSNFEGIEQLLLEGVRAGVEWLDLEATLPVPLLNRLLAATQTSSVHQHRTRVLGSLHTAALPTESSVRGMLSLASLDGRGDMCKVVTGARGDSDSVLVQQVAKQFSSQPFIALCLGQAGELSRVLNGRFTPVTHPSLTAAAPGQLQVQTLLQRREGLGLLRRRQFYLLGHPISQSLSPAMHNAAYRHLHLPYAYQLAESGDVHSYASLIRSESFGGASVTIPHKEDIMAYLDEVDEHALFIGAVNTIVVQDHELRGYNTDWLGMLRPIQYLLQVRQLADPTPRKGIGLVIGAGGTARAACYVLRQLGLDLYIANRTPIRAQELASRFRGKVADIDNLQHNLNSSRLAVIISTVPANVGYTVPSELLASRPVVLDVVYKPASTPLLQQAAAAGCLFIQGGTMLLEQGLEQFELWNKRKAPRDIMSSAIFSLGGLSKIDCT